MLSSYRSKSTLDFALSSQHDYQPGDTIEGNVIFHPPGDIILHDPCITLEGTSRTVLWDPELERRSGGPCVAHKFLQLKQPFETSGPGPAPEPTLHPKTTHLFSFAFNLPSELPSQSCRHPCSSPEVQDSHLRLPPSFPGKGPSPGNLDPSRVTISYNVRFRAMAVHPDTKQDLYRIDRIHNVVVCMQPVPVLIPGSTCLASKEIVLRDLGRRTGRLTASAGEPKPIHLQQRTTLLPIYFRFCPDGKDKLPPRPHKAHTRLEATTYFGTKPYTTLPDQDGLSAGTRQQRAFKKYVALSSRDVHLNWTPSQKTGTGTPAETETEYTGCLVLPVILPGAVVPSFYSCLVARVYALCVEVSFHSHLVGSTVSLRVPVHLTS